MNLADRIVELRLVNTTELIPNPKNWRLHPEYQRDALRTVINEVGIADAVIARQTDEGLMLIDGHLRIEELDGEVPVLVVDLDEEEADFLLATLDPLSMEAEKDHAAFRELANAVSVTNEDFGELLHDLDLQWTTDALEEEKQKTEKDKTHGAVSISKVAVQDAKRLITAINLALGNEFEVRSF